MSQSSQTLTVQGHSFTAVTEQTSSGAWRVEVINAAKSAFAFDPEFSSRSDALAHAEEALNNTDITHYLG